MVLICVLPQVALWGKGNLCVFVAIFAALRPLLPQAATFLTSVSSYKGGCGFEVSLNDNRPN